VELVIVGAVFADAVGVGVGVEFAGVFGLTADEGAAAEAVADDGAAAAAADEWTAPAAP
jgi:hypothetical protein